MRQLTTYLKTSNKTSQRTNMGNQDSKMTVTIDRLYGEDFTLEVEEGDSVYSVKYMIFGILSIDPAQQMLTYQDQMMENDKTMAFYNIKEGSIIHLSVWSSESGAVMEI